ncbi:MAG: SUMF1/EgtB/PvdO family nonheme iron enzyme [Rhodothermales bacterium]|nr:SUMF1/EgtB/PvdO family nonheme iron enzyme [Rhodothermales bacterium]
MLKPTANPPIVMISSTALDLPVYRDQVMDACLRLGLMPKMMEQLPAGDPGAVETSLEMVDEATVYVGIFAHRYGTIPKGHETSITHQEYDRARLKGIPCLIFVMDDDVPVPPKYFDRGVAAEKLEAFKKALMTDHVVARFTTPEDLGKQALDSLRRYVRPAEHERSSTSPPDIPPEPAPVDRRHGLPEIDFPELPLTPYRRLQRFTRADAGVFFGRDREIVRLYNALAGTEYGPVVLFYGESGVGKSSLLEAGVFPYLETVADVRMKRRKPERGLSGTLADLLGVAPDPQAIAEAWHRIEERGKPLVVILDQVEEYITLPMPDPRTEEEKANGVAAPDEMGLFKHIVRTVFAVKATRPKGRLVLSFRKEWLAELEKSMGEAGISPYSFFMDRLSQEGVMEIVRGPASAEALRTKYRLTVHPDLPALISRDILRDTGSPAAPVLSILLARMWERAKALPGTAPVFTLELYATLSEEGLGLGDFVDQQLKELREWDPVVVASGLAIDILAAHVTERVTAGALSDADVECMYPHVKDRVHALRARAQKAYLLVSTQVAGEAGLAHPVTRLAHDTLAPIVLQRYKASNASGQRAERLLESRAPDWKDGKKGGVLDAGSLAEVQNGATGMRKWDDDERRLVKESRNARKNQRFTLGATFGAMVLLFSGIVGMYVYSNRHNVCLGSTQAEWCRICIDHDGEWQVEGQETDTYCVGATFDRLTEADLVELRPGVFTMVGDGDEEQPIREVTISMGFKMGATEVTQAQWYAEMGANPSYSKGHNLPVENVSWMMAQAFIDSLNARHVGPGTFRLPTEAEWEYACRAGFEGDYGFDETGKLTDHAWISENSNSQTQPVGGKTRNAFGFYDMHGNVWEWVEDGYAAYDSTQVVDPVFKPMDTDASRVLRGGSFGNDAENVRCADRFDFNPGIGSLNFGFRVVFAPPYKNAE